ncbi:hypothetical protein SEA_ERENYEAGER_32 [Microbacterium phage Erenyeager]|nr:hypothetical protein SEA_ERENYEAGER_32 [Microbacterium phage Erenyeager]
MGNKQVEIRHVEFTFDHKGAPTIWSDLGVEYPNVEEILALSEWVAEAYTALTGAEYVHTEYDKGEFVVKEGVAAIPKRGAPVTFATAIEGLERDCE